jgi:hypothetical protein
MSQDTDKIEKCAEFIAEALILGKLVYGDKQVDLADIQHAPKAVALLQKGVEVAQAYKELVEESKDLKPEEILALVAKAIELVKKVEETK